jgi:CRP/FNR family transcriptional regulator
MQGRPGKVWYLRRVDMFRELSPAEIQELAAMVELRAFRPRERVMAPDMLPQRIYIVKEGTVRLFHRGPDGREVTVHLMGPGRLFGLSALFGSRRDGLLAEAVTDAVLCDCQAVDLLRVFARWPKVMLSLIRQLGAQLVQTERRLGRVASADTRTRLAGELHRLAHEAGEDVPGGGRRLPAAVTHADLARQIGASRETVTRLLASLQAEGYIRREGRRLVVADPAKLAETFELSDE